MYNPLRSLKEKFHIIYKRPGSSLNKREEILIHAGIERESYLSFPLSKEIQLWKQLWKQFLSPEDRNTCLLCETILYDGKFVIKVI